MNHLSREPMHATGSDSGITLSFPAVQRSRETPRRYRTGVSAEGGLYIAHQSEPTLTAPPSGKPTESGYYFNHPTQVGLMAFQEHQDFVLAPQMIGAQILLDFGEYVHRNAERCAPLFNGTVGRKQKLKLWLEPGETLRDTAVLERALSEWKRGVLAQTDSRIAGSLHPRFSKASATDDMVYSGLLMGAAREFFEYSWGTLCGIPQITVKGTRDDWEQIRGMVTALGTLRELTGLPEFYDWMNENVLEGILGLYDGREDPDFWRSIVKYESRSGSEGQSGGWLPSMNLYCSARNEGQRIVPVQGRWRAGHDPGQMKHTSIPVVHVEMVSDSWENPLGPNEDPGMDAYAGFVGMARDDEGFRPILGIHAFESDRLSR